MKLICGRCNHWVVGVVNAAPLETSAWDQRSYGVPTTTKRALGPRMGKPNSLNNRNLRLWNFVTALISLNHPNLPHVGLSLGFNLYQGYRMGGRPGHWKHFVFADLKSDARVLHFHKTNVSERPKWSSLGDWLLIWIMTRSCNLMVGDQHLISIMRAPSTQYLKGEHHDESLFIWLERGVVS